MTQLHLFNNDHIDDEEARAIFRKRITDIYGKKLNASERFALEMGACAEYANTIGLKFDRIMADCLVVNARLKA